MTEDIDLHQTLFRGIMPLMCNGTKTDLKAVGVPTRMPMGATNIASALLTVNRLFSLPPAAIAACSDRRISSAGPGGAPDARIQAPHNSAPSTRG